ncbi:MAG: hypothetical protein ACU85V_06895 [Gammaproteobacteria bacterium]
MYSFDVLLRASSDELLAIFAATRVGPLDDHDARREQIAQQFGVRVPQLLCALGFNAATPQQQNVCQALGFADFGGLAAARNYAFIHDVYNALSINNVLEVYAVLNRLDEPGMSWSDLVLTRMNNIESQLEETINPILIGGYKLEIRAIYENNLASPEFVRGRLTANHAVMRDIANENAIMLERGAIDPLAFLECEGVSADEKRRAMFQGLVPPAVADHYIRQIGSEEEQRRFREALSGSTS